MNNEDLLKRIFEDKKITAIVYDMPHYTKDTQDTYQNILIDYINTPCIIDVFGTDHAQRRIWRNSKEDAVREYIRSTCLAVNVISGALSSLNILAEEHPQIEPKIRDIIDVAYWVEAYNTLTTIKKMGAAYKLKTVAKNVLEEIQ